MGKEIERKFRVNTTAWVPQDPGMHLTRSEFEYTIPVDDAAAMLRHLCEQPLIDKHRHVEMHAGRKWEIDVFHGENEGLVVAEVELPSEDTPLELPLWVDEDVSSDPRYFNSNLLKQPYTTWHRS